MPRVPTISSHLPDQLTNGPEDVSSIDSWDDLNEEDGKRSLTRRLKFFFTCLGYSVGLGNIWRFPYMIHRNGGAFLLPFTIMVVFLGMPLYYLEIVIAQFTSLGPVAIWDLSPFFKGIGYAMTLVSIITSMYYNVITSWTFLYLIKTLSAVVPWDVCTESMYSPSCESENNLNATDANDTRNNHSEYLEKKEKFYSEFFFLKSVLNLSDDMETIGYPQWQLSLCLLVVSLCIGFCLAKNIKSFGKVSYFTSTMIIVFLAVFLVKVISNEGQTYVYGVKYFINIDWNKMKTSQVWIDAAYEVIFSLGPCFGGLIALAKKNDFHHDCYKDALFVVIVNSVLSVFGGFVVYALLGHFGEYINLENTERSISEGIGISFIVYPMALSEMPVPQLWSAIFFLVLFLIGLESNMGIAYTAVHAIRHAAPHQIFKNRTVASLLVTLLLTGGGILLVLENGLYIILLLDTYCMGQATLLIALFECIVISYIYGMNRLSSDMKAMFKEAPSSYWKIMWRVISPALIVALLLFNWLDSPKVTIAGHYVPEWVQILRWVIVGSVIVIIVFYMIYSLISKVVHNEPIAGLCTPESDWGPKKPEKMKKFQSALYDTACDPVLMVRVSIDADEISPTGMIIGAKPDSVIPFGFFINQNQKKNPKQRNRMPHQTSHVDLTMPIAAIQQNFWESSEANKFASIASSHASSSKSTRGSLSSINQGTQTEKNEAHSSDTSDECELKGDSSKNESDSSCKRETKSAEFFVGSSKNPTIKVDGVTVELRKKPKNKSKKKNSITSQCKDNLGYVSA